MIPGSSTRIVDYLFEQIGSGLQDYAAGASTTMIGYVGPIAAALLTIYVLLWGVGLASGQITEPFTDGIKRLLRICVIVGLALTAGVYQDVVVDFLERAPAELASRLQDDDAQASTDDKGLAKVLDDSIAQGLGLGNEVWDTATVVSRLSLFAPTSDGLMLQLLALITYLVVILTVALAAATIFVAHTGLALLLAIGPLFILMALFPQTRRWFEAWLGQAVRFLLLYVFVACASALLFPLLTQYYQALTSLSGAAEALLNALKGIGLSLVIAWVVLQLHSIAKALGEGAAIQLVGAGGRLWGSGTAVVSSSAGAASAPAVRRAAGGDAARRTGTTARAGAGMARRTAVKRTTIQEG